MKEIEKQRTLTFKTRLIARLIYTAVRVICATVRLRVVGEETSNALIAKHNGALFVTWHGRTLIPVHHFRHRGYWALISMSRDGDLQAENFRLFGFRIVRGSTGRRGVTATREILAALEAGGVLAFTPDGPRGPTRKVQPGVVYFAQRSGKPIIPTGVSAYPRWEISTWDRYLIPKPFSKARWLFGEPIFVAPGDDMDEAARRVEESINALEAEAERQVPAAEEKRDGVRARASRQVDADKRQSGCANQTHVKIEKRPAKTQE